MSDFFIFVFGLLAGSFLNSVIYRLEQGLPFPWLRSFCPKCRHHLGFWDLVPVFSFIFLRGKCRYCSQKISWQYLLVELFTGIIFLLIFLLMTHINNYTGVYLLIYMLFLFFISSFLIIIFVYDLKHYIIPDRIVYPAIGLAFIYQLFGIWNFGNWDLFEIWNLGLGILPSFFLLSIILASQGRWMGMGDFKLAILMGLILGWPTVLVAFFLAFLIGAIIGIGLIIFGRKTLKSEVPFGPFLIIGTFIALFWGEQIISWYLNLL